MIELTKWPRLLVSGDPVTRQQANEILIRTSTHWLGLNNKAWQREAYRILGMPSDDDGPGALGAYTAQRAVWEQLGAVDLQYLQNSRIGSSWIGGPHGWCDWSGFVGCSTWNIGKWPGYQEVTEDWTAIAEAFPYLRLRSQLVTDEGEGELACTWDVADGKVAVVPGVTEWVTATTELTGDEIVARLVFTHAAGVGVSAERLQEAVDQVRGSAALPG